MNSQVRFLTPVISAVVIGITSMITNILGTLSEKVQSVSSGAAGAGMTTSSVLDMFGVGIPTYQFQIVVGLYVVQLAYVLSIIANGIANGPDKIGKEATIGKNMTKSAILYFALAFIIIAASVIVYSIIYSILFGINIFHYEMDIILPTIFLPIISIISSFALAACLASIFKKQGATIAFAVIYFLFYPLMIYGIVILTIQMNLYTAMGQGNSIIWYGILVMILCCLRLDFYYTNLINGIGRFNIISMRTNGQLFSLTSMFNYNFAISIDALISLIFLICFSVVMLILSISRLSLMDVID